MIAAVTDLGGTITGVQRTWLDPSGAGQGADRHAATAMGDLLGNAVRFGVARDVMAAGEGIETMLSLRCVMPTMPMIAALSAAHLAAILFPATLRRLYIARDDDPAGDSATVRLIDRAHEAGIEAITCRRAGRLQRGSAHASASTRCGQRSGRRSLRRTSLASWNRRHESGTGDDGALAPRSHAARSWRSPVLSERTATTAFSRGRSLRQTARPGNGGWPAIFRRAGKRRLYIAKQNSRPPPSSAALRPLRFRCAVQVRSACRLSSP